MIEFVNHNNHQVILSGQKGEIITFNKNERKILPEYFIRYVPRYLKMLQKPNIRVERKIDPVRQIPTRQIPVKQIKQIFNKQTQIFPKNTSNIKLPQQNKEAVRPILQSRLIQPTQSSQPSPPPPQQQHLQPPPQQQHLQPPPQQARLNNIDVLRKQKASRLAVGRSAMSLIRASQHFKEVINRMSYPISNDIGIGILSYNRPNSIKRLIDSIRNYTDLLKTTIFISDESSNQDVKRYLSTISDMIVLDNKDRLGIAGNTNRLLKCLSRFKYKILLNDDVEILSQGWESFYVEAMHKSGYHHFCYKQNGLCGATPNDALSIINGVNIKTIPAKPQGAVLAFDDLAFKKVGYFDESFGQYGMEHVDWSQRISRSGIQPAGYHDVLQSDKHFHTHADTSAVQQRISLLTEARKLFEQKSAETRMYVNCSDKIVVPSISCVIPFQGLDRRDAIRIVLQNIKAQRFPNIEIVMVEQDETIKTNIGEFDSVNYLLSKSDTKHFVKSTAFNLGVSKVSNKKVILHDADILAQANYFKTMYDLLDKYDGVHIGKNVLYLDPESTQNVISTGILSKDNTIGRAVGYFEGGSLGCTLDTYIKIGGFNERFIGYGCFCPGNYVLTNVGYKPIEKVVSGDSLYTHNRRFKEIIIKSRQYNGEVLDIFVPGRLSIVGVTPEHPFLVKNGMNYVWKCANELEIGDNIDHTDFIPELVPPYNLNDIFDNDLSKNKFNYIHYINQFCYILGLYLAEGVIQTPDRLRITYMWLHRNEEWLAKEVRRIIGILNNDINTIYKIYDNSCEIRIFNSLLAKLIYAITGKKKALDKIISTNFINTLTEDNICHLLGGMFDGDANHGTGSEHRLVYHTISMNLAMIVSGLLRKCGIPHSFYKRKYSNKTKISFDLCVNREYEHKIKLLYPRKPIIGSNSFGKTKFGLVGNIKHRRYSGPVYNFEVFGDHSYIVNGLVVHNCEDCEFFNRLSSTKFFNERTEEFVHLHHGRAPGWDNCHNINKIIESQCRLQPIKELIKNLYDKLIAKYGFTQ